MAREEFLLVEDREVVLTSRMAVMCNGAPPVATVASPGGERLELAPSPLGHPVEYLTLEKGGEVMCGYCSRRYVHIDSDQAEALRELGQPYAV